MSPVQEHHNELVVQQQAVAPSLLTTEQLRFISTTEFVPKSMRGNLPAILACVATGRALGLPDMTALRSINIIDGKAAFSAELMVSRVRQAGHSITFEASGEACKVHGRRGDNGDEGSFEWTLDMAKRANLLTKANWKAYPEAMLWARAASQLCRMLFPDCFAGATYTPDEAEEITVDELMDEPVADESIIPGLEEELLELSGLLGVREKVAEAMADRSTNDDYAAWLAQQIVNAQHALAEREAAE